MPLASDQAHWCRLVKIFGGTKILGRKKVAITNETISISQLLGARARPPKSTPMTKHQSMAVSDVLAQGPYTILVSLEAGTCALKGKRMTAPVSETFVSPKLRLYSAPAFNQPHTI